MKSKMATNMKITLTKLGLDMNFESKSWVKVAYGRLDFDRSSLKWNYDSFNKKSWMENPFIPLGTNPSLCY